MKGTTSYYHPANSEDMIKIPDKLDLNKCWRCQQDSAPVYLDNYCKPCYVIANTEPPSQLDRIEQKLGDLAGWTQTADDTDVRIEQKLDSILQWQQELRERADVLLVLDED